MPLFLVHNMKYQKLLWTRQLVILGVITIKSKESHGNKDNYVFIFKNMNK